MTDFDYLKIAVNAARGSPDQSTQNGAVLVPRSGPAVIACNRPPERLRINDQRLERVEKYKFFEHAERSAVFQAARQGICTDGATLYCLWYACPECARAIIMAGITEVVGLTAMNVLTPQRWRADVKLGSGMLAEAGVRTRLFDRPLAMQVKFDGCSIGV